VLFPHKQCVRRRRYQHGVAGTSRLVYAAARLAVRRILHLLRVRNVPLYFLHCACMQSKLIAPFRRLLSNVNRYALMGFSFPSILTFTQFLFCTVAIRVLCGAQQSLLYQAFYGLPWSDLRAHLVCRNMFGLATVEHPSFEILKTFSPLVLCNYAAIIGGTKERLCGLLWCETRCPDRFASAGATTRQRCNVRDVQVHHTHLCIHPGSCFAPA
jgi:hypothetical protein